MCQHYNLNLILIQFLIILVTIYIFCLSHTLKHENYLISDFGNIYISKMNHFNHFNDQTTVIVPKDLTPVELMIDLTNDLSYRILHYHSILNRNNFAFSPTALMSVLVALYEGSTEHSAIEIKNNLLLPNNRDIIRIGYRDIHRRLRTYFFDMDNPLKGLSLNKQNVTVTQSFENLLKFYGYDLSMDMVAPSIIGISNQTKNIQLMDVEAKTALINNNDNKIENTTQVMSITLKQSTSKKTPLSTTTAATTTVTYYENDATTEIPILDTKMPTENLETTTIEITTVKAISSSSISSSAAPEITTNANVPEIKANEEASELVASSINNTSTSAINTEPFARFQKARVTRLPSGKLQTPLTNTNMPKINYLPSEKNKRAKLKISSTNSTNSTKRIKRHLIDLNNVFLHEYKHTLINNNNNNNNNNNKNYKNNVPFSHFGTLTHEIAYETYVDPNFISSLTGKPNYNTDIISHVFYLNSEQTIYTTFKVYSAVLYYKYFVHLHMSMIEMELDTIEYNLLIILPDYHIDMTSAAASLHLAPKLRYLRRELKPKWVQAIIPDFQLHGAIFLTNDLQNMGINDIFEPNRADFRPMTSEKDVYIKHIEQSIYVHIRTHPISQLKYANGQDTQPIQISVNHPFMFFIVDRDLDIAVMAGRILNPLNVRIQ